MDAVYGMRRGELLGLQWPDLDQNADLIRVRHTVTDVPGDHLCPYCRRTHRRLHFGTPKSAAGERLYPLVPAVSAALMEQRLRQDHERALYGRTTPNTSWCSRAPMATRGGTTGSAASSNG